MIHNFIINPEFRGDTIILINGITPADGTILYLSGGIVKGLPPPLVSTNQALYIRNGTPYWDNIVTSSVATNLPFVKNASMNSNNYQSNKSQESGGVSGGMIISLISFSPDLSSKLIISDSFIDILCDNSKNIF